jgi:hypothetical protein
MCEMNEAQLAAAALALISNFLKALNLFFAIRNLEILFSRKV